MAERVPRRGVGEGVAQGDGREGEGVAEGGVRAGDGQDGGRRRLTRVYHRGGVFKCES